MIRTTLIIFITQFFCSQGIGQVTYIVNSTNDVDDGTCDAIHCSLREAINASNIDLMPSTIEFAVGTGNIETIMLNDALPIITEDSTIIDGMTQTGNPGGVRIDCGNIGAQQQDILRIHGSHTQVYGLEIFNYTVSEDAMVIGAGSLIGVGGIFVLASPTTVQIGGPGKGNILHSVFRTRSTAANYGNGIAIHSGTEIIIQGNRIGTNYNADTPLEVYGEGIRVDENNFGETQIGGPGLDEGNIIGTCFNGIGIYGGDGFMKGNHIGVNRDLDIDLGNRNVGIFIRDGDYYEVGGTMRNEGNHCFHNISGIEIRTLANIYVGHNVCAFNDPSFYGIFTAECQDCLFQFNECYNNGTGMRMEDNGRTSVIMRFNEVYNNFATGFTARYRTSTVNSPITQNSTYCNGEGISVEFLDGPNLFSPVSYNSVSATQVIGLATPNVTIEVFEHDTTGCPNAMCQGKYYLGTTTTDASGLWTYNDVFVPGNLYTVTQTLNGNVTSEFAPCFQVPDCSTIVTTPADNGPGSLREAIICANVNPGPDTITFDIMGGIPRTIDLQSNLPALTDNATVIDATTQPNNFPMNEQITINCGNLSGLGTTGLRIEGDSCEIYGLKIINSDGHGILAGRDIDPINHFVLGAPQKYNVLVDNDQTGAYIYVGSDITIQSNYFGLSPTFAPPFRPSRTGCQLELNDRFSNMLIGGAKSLEEGNYFGFCLEEGCNVIGGGIGSESQIQGNYFGTDRMSTVMAPNGSAGSGTGALSISNTNSNISNNDFAFNLEAGIFASGGDHEISLNSFLCNEGGGIDHNSRGQMGNPDVTAPEIISASNSMISGTSQGAGAIEIFFHDDSQCPGVPCQGAVFLGVVITNNGDWSLNGPFGLSDGDQVTTTFSNNSQTSEFSECVTICPELEITVDNTGPYCEGDSVTLTSEFMTTGTQIQYLWTGPNGYMSTAASPTGQLEAGTYSLKLTIDGCEYAVQNTVVVVLDTSYTLVDTTICAGDFLMIGGERFDSTRPAGQVVLTNQFNCDSTVEVNLNFKEPGTTLIMDTLCFEDFVIVNGQRYDRDRPSGEELISSANQCDSLVIVDLVFRSQNINDFNRTLCFGDSIVINGVVYNENNPNGTDTLLSQSGCDSIINVSLDFGNARIENIDTLICRNEVITINGVNYSRNNLSGSDTIPMGSSNGCDSIINVNVDLRSEAVYDLDTTLCPKGSIVVNGIQYDQFYMEGTDTIFGGSFHGCDSVINVRIRYPVPDFDIDTISPNCDGSQLGQFIINDISGIPGPFSFSLGGRPFSDILSFPWTIDALDEGIYELIFLDNRGCRYLVQLALVATGGIDFSVNTPVEIELGDSTRLTYIADFTPDSIIWKDQDGNIVCVDCEELFVTPGQTMTYTVRLFRDGCSSEKTIVVEVDDSINFFTPNIFSPDGDGINDYFNVFSDVPGLIVEHLRIYDRWGEIIYHGENLDATFDQGWDGTFNGEQVNPGVYVFVFDLVVPGGRKEKLHGSVTVLR